jgi:hypothetical protein
MSIEIKPSEIESVDSIGELDGEQVKLVKTRGGLYIAVGRPRGKKKEEVIAAGSHPAIVKYNIEKSFAEFQPAMMKSEAGEESIVAGMSDLLPADMRKSGYDLYVLRKSNAVDFVLTQSQIEVISFPGYLIDSDLILFKSDKVVTSDIVPAMSAITTAAAMVAIDEDKTGIVHENKRYNPKAVLKKTWA